MKTVEWVLLGGVALLALVLFAPFAFVGHLGYRVFSKRYDVWYYFQAIAVGADNLGASFIYGSKRHTISAITGAKAHHGDKWHKLQERAIDALFGSNHCFKQAVDERLIGENFR